MIEEEAPSRVRVTRSDGAEAILENPQVQGDTLYGSAPKGEPWEDGEKVGVPLAEVKHVAVRRGDGVKTVAAVLVSAAVVAGTVLLISLASIRQD
jgi:hypothetical protein